MDKGLQKVLVNRREDAIFTCPRLSYANRTKLELKFVFVVYQEDEGFLSRSEKIVDKPPLLLYYILMTSPGKRIRQEGGAGSGKKVIMPPREGKQNVKKFKKYLDALYAKHKPTGAW